MPSLGPLNRGLWWMLDRMLRRLDGPLKAALNEAGMPSPELRLFRGRSPLLHLVACSPSIMAVPADLPPTTHVTGAWVDPRPPAPLPGPVEAFLAAGAPPILVSFGSMASDSAAFHAAAVTGALGKARLRAVVQGLPVTASDAILPVGAVDHRALLPRMFAALHHGGAGTTHAVVRAGRPSVVVPHVGDQPYWAMRLERLGVAPPPIASKDLSEELLAERLALATAAAMRERAARLGEAVASEAGTAAAVEAIAALNRPASGGVTDPGGPSR
jgi:UDP:flavonoid glycosyltransferase YjiC (YdhE family)